MRTVAFPCCHQREFLSIVRVFVWEYHLALQATNTEADVQNEQVCRPTPDP